MLVFGKNYYENKEKKNKNKTDIFFPDIVNLSKVTKLFSFQCLFCWSLCSHLQAREFHETRQSMQIAECKSQILILVLYSPILLYSILFRCSIAVLRVNSEVAFSCISHSMASTEFITCILFLLFLFSRTARESGYGALPNLDDYLFLFIFDCFILYGLWFSDIYPLTSLGNTFFA